MKQSFAVEVVSVAFSKATRSARRPIGVPCCARATS